MALMKSRRAATRSTIAEPTPTPIPALAPVLRPVEGEAALDTADAVGLLGKVDEGGSEDVMLVLLDDDDDDDAVSWELVVVWSARM